MKKYFLLLILLLIFSGCSFLNIKNKDEIRVLKEALINPKNLNLSYEESGKLIDIRDIGITNEGYFIIEGREKKALNIYDGLGNFLRTITDYSDGSGLCKIQFPSSIACYENNNIIYLLDSMGNKILIYNLNGIYLGIFYDFSDSEEDMPYYPVLIRKNKMTNYLIVVDTYNHRLIEINESKTVVLEIKDGGSNDGKLEFPQSVTTDQAGNYYVADGAVIKVYSARGGYLFKIKKKMMGNVTDLVIWNSKYLVAADSENKKVLFFSKSGEYLTSFDSPLPGIKFENPYRLYVDNSERLYIVDNELGEIFYY